MKTKKRRVSTTKKSPDDLADILAFLRTPEARARLAEEEAKIHRIAIIKSRERSRKYGFGAGPDRIIRETTR